MAEAKNKLAEDVEAAIEELMAEQADEKNGAGLPGEPAHTEIELADELTELRAERDELRDKFMRALADAENIRKRGERDRREAEQYGGSRLARDMLPVYDNLKRALEAAGEGDQKAAPALIEGIELTMRELLNIFQKHGIRRVAPEVGERFDPDFHQAMFEAPVPETKAGDIIQVMAEGFTLHDRLLRPAQVGVSSTPG